MRLRAARADDEGERAPPGGSRLGGEPDLPRSTPWPTEDGKPLSFIAQLDLASLAKFEASRELPAQGLLSFFSGGVEALGGRRFRTPVRVLHLTPGDGPLERRATPERARRAPEYDVEPEEEAHALPPVESPFYEALLPEEHALAFRASMRGDGGEAVDFLGGLGAFLSSRPSAGPEGPAHRLLGYATTLQGDPYVAAEVQCTGRGALPADDLPGAHEVRRRACRWRLLLQIDAYGDGEFLLNQDGGYFYFFIPERALACHDWAQAWGDLQCG